MKYINIRRMSRYEYNCGFKNGNSLVTATESTPCACMSCVMEFKEMFQGES